MCGVVEDGEGVEEGDTELGEGIEVLGERMDELCGDGAERKGEDEVGRKTMHAESRRVRVVTKSLASVTPP